MPVHCRFDLVPNLPADQGRGEVARRAAPAIRGHLPAGNGNEIVMLNKPIMAAADRAGNILKGHLWAAVAAAWTFAAGNTILVSDLSSGPLFRLLLTMCSIFALVFFAALIAGFLPSLLIWALARQYSIGGSWYFAAAFAAAGAILCAVIVILRSDGIFGLPPDPELSQAMTGMVLLTALSGAVGGLVFWWVVGRFIRKADTLPANA